MNFWPEVRVMTVSGVISMCSIRSEFRIRAEWFSLVTFIILRTPHSGTRILSIVISMRNAGLYILIRVESPCLGFLGAIYSNPPSLTI